MSWHHSSHMATSKWQKDTESPLYTFESKDWRYRGCCTCSRLRQAWCRLWSSLTWGTSSASRRVMMNSAWLMGKHELYNCAISICPLKTFKGYWKKQGLWNWRFLLYMLLRELFIFVLQRFPQVCHPSMPALAVRTSLHASWSSHDSYAILCLSLFYIAHVLLLSTHFLSYSDVPHRAYSRSIILQPRLFESMCLARLCMSTDDPQNLVTVFSLRCACSAKWKLCSETCRSLYIYN